MLYRMIFTVVTLTFCFQTAGLLSAASKNLIGKLAAEYQAGKVKPCEKLARIAMSDSISWQYLKKLTGLSCIVRIFYLFFQADATMNDLSLRH